MSRTMLIASILFLQCSFCIRFFNREYYLSFEPPNRYKESESLFGFSTIYSPDNKKFYVGAPLSKKDTDDTQTGAVFQCDLISKQCSKYFRIPDETTYNGENTKKKKPLFGITMANTNPNEVLICCPNIKYSRTEAFYCYKYNIRNGGLVTSKGLIKVKESASYEYFTNYGMTLAHKVGNTDKRVLIGNTIYLTGSHARVKSPYVPVVLVEPNGNVKEVSIFRLNKRTIVLIRASYTILFNPLDDDIKYMVITYYLSNNLKGSFEIITKDDRSHQYADISYGSSGQYFGFSGTFGVFDKDNCIDLAISAPFYTQYMDEGRVYIFFCDQKTNKYDLEPMVLFGDNEIFGRFGISVVEIGERYNDGIQNIAVLAPFWYDRNPVIYIYSSNGEKLNSNYVDKIDLINEHDSLPILSYGLLSHIKVSNPNYYDLLVQFPNNNAIKILSAVEFNKLEVDVKTEVVNEVPDPIEQCFTLDEFRRCYLTSKYRIITCVKILFLNNKEKLVKDVLKLKYSLHDSPGAYFTNNRITKDESDSDHVFGSLCFQNYISYLYTSTSVAPIVVKIEASIDHSKYDDFGGYFSDSDPIIAYHKIPTHFAECDAKSCSPNFKIFDESYNGIFQKGLVSNMNLKFKIVNEGRIVSYSWKLVIECPIWVDVVSIHFNKIAEQEVVREIQSSDDSQIISFYINRVAQISEILETEIVFEIRAPLSIDSAKIDISIMDTMYVHIDVVRTSISLSSDSYAPVSMTWYLLSGHSSSTPSKIGIRMDERQEKNTNGLSLEYFFEIKNMAVSEPMEDVVVEIKVTTSFNNIKFLKLTNIEVPTDFNEEGCNSAVRTDCSSLKFLLKPKYLPAQSSRIFYLNYEVKDTVSQLIKLKPEKFDVFSSLCFKNAGKKVCKELKTHTDLFYPKEREITSVLPVIIGVTTSCLILIALTIVIIKTKFLQRFKKGQSIN